MKTVLITATALLAILTVVAGCRTSRSAYATAPYKRERSSGKFELRDYPKLTLVETPMTDADGNSGFGRLFRYITGRNDGKQKIAMTTPVFMSGDQNHPAMAFVMPAELKADQVPKPTDKSIVVREVPADRFAVLRFNGGRNAKNEAEALAQLKTWMATEGLSVLSPPVFAYFDPPWTPSFLRRNEVMVRTKADSKWAAWEKPKSLGSRPTMHKAQNRKSPAPAITLRLPGLSYQFTAQHIVFRTTTATALSKLPRREKLSRLAAWRSRGEWRQKPGNSRPLGLSATLPQRSEPHG